MAISHAMQVAFLFNYPVRALVNTILVEGSSKQNL